MKNNLSEILEYEQPTKYIVHSENYDNSFPTPVLTPGQSFVLGYTNETEGIFSNPLPVIIFDDFTTAVKLVNFPFKVKSSAMKILKPASDKVYIPYWYYYLLSVKTDTTLHKRYWISSFANKRVSTPSYTEQKQIANRLDKVQKLIAKQKEQLKKLDLLIKSKFIDIFGDPISNPKKWEAKTGKQSFCFSSGKFNPTINLKDDNPYPCYGGNGITGYSKNILISEATLVIGRVGAYCGNVIKTEANSWITDNAIYLSFYENKNYNLVFLFYLFTKLDFHRFANFSGQPKITQKPLLDLAYIMPPLELQSQFADFVKSVERQKEVFSSRLSHLETLYKSLMQEYFG